MGFMLLMRQCVVVYVCFNFVCTGMPMGNKEDHIEITEEEKQRQIEQDMEYYRYISQVIRLDK